MDTDLTRAVLERGVLAAMEHAANHAMQWGVDDCSLWCADILKGALGYDAAERFRGRYKTRVGARRVLGKGGLMEALVANAREFGWLPIRRGEQPGDIAILLGQKGAASAAICRAPGWFVGRELNGYAAIPTKLVSAMWAVI